MSAESEIAQILNGASTDAFLLAGASSRAVQRAVEIIEQPVDWRDAIEFKPKAAMISDGTGTGKASEEPFRFPYYPWLRPVAFPALQTPSGLKNKSAPDAPILTLPDTQRFDPSVVPPLLASPPQDGILSTFDVPLLADTDMPSFPEFMEFEPLDIPELRIPYLQCLPPPPARLLPLDLAQETMTGIQGLLFDSPDGLNHLLARFRSDARDSNAFLELVLGASSLSPLLTSNGLAAAIEDALARIKRMLARLELWPLPARSQSALLAEVDRLAARWAALAKGAVAAEGQARKLDYQAAARAALVAFAQKAGDLQGLEIDLSLKAHAFAGRYAKRMIGVLLEAHEARYFLRYDTTLAQAETALATHEAQLTASLLQLDLAEARLTREKTLQSRDENAVQRYAEEAQTAQREVAHYAALVSAAKKERDLKQMPYEHWALQLKAAAQLTDADMAQADMAQAELAGDKTALEAAAARLKLYQAQASAYEHEGKRLQDAARVTDINNDTLIREYQARIKQRLMQKDQEAARAEYDLDQRIALMELALDQSRLEIEKLKVTQDFEEQKNESELKEREIAVQRLEALLDAEAERLRGLAEVHLTGATITSRMAEAAASQATRLVGATEREG